MPGEKYGSRLIPGVGSGTLQPTAPSTVADAGTVSAPDVPRALWPAPTGRWTETGIRLPPMSRNAAVAPYEVARAFWPSGFHEATPAVRVMVPTPSAARPPNAWPLPALSLGAP